MKVFPPSITASLGSIHEGIWEWLELDQDDRELLARYVDAVGLGDATIESARDAFAGTAETEADFAESFAEEMGGLPEDMPTWIVVDWEASWNCNLRHDFSTSRGEDGTVWFFHQ